MPDIPAVPARGSPYVGGLDVNSGEGATQNPIILVDNPQRGDARSWWRRVLRFMAPSGGRSEVLTTDAELQTGAAPLRIVRTLTDQRGKTGPLTNALYTGSYAYIPGMDISNKNAGKAVGGLRTMDDNVSIPAIYSGNPS